MRPTPYADVNQLLAELRIGIRRVLGHELVGLYLFGSLATGDFDPGTSDVDLLAALSADVDDGELERLGVLHRAIVRDRPDWEDRVEVLYKSQAGLRSFRSEETPLVAISPGEPLHRKTSGRDYLINWYQVREKGVRLEGPPPEEILDPIAWEEFVECVRRYACEYREVVRGMRSRRAQAYAILTLCRALHACERGEAVSKRAAAEWARDRLPEWSALIADAVVWRDAWRDGVDDAEAAATHPATVRFVAAVADRIGA